MNERRMACYGAAGAFALFCVFAGPAASSAAPGDGAVATTGAKAAPRELGVIGWLRGFDSAAAKAKAVGKPLLVLFQEVPGCDTCVNYGDHVLSHPLVADAAETLFVPVAVYNNIKGDDRRALESFREPAWNNPVVRIVTHDRKALTGRVANDYTVAGIASAMVSALRKLGRDVPPYLQLLAEETAAETRGLQKATFAMHCFWEGEGELGQVPGVIATLPGFLQEKEIVEVNFDPDKISYSTLVKKARALDCASTVFTRSERQQAEAGALVGSAAVRTDQAIRRDKEPKYYLSKTSYRHVPMTGLQAARVNAAIGRKQDPGAYLSPGQLGLLRMIMRHPSAGWPDAIGATDLPKAWRAAEAVARSLRK